MRRQVDFTLAFRNGIIGHVPMIGFTECSLLFICRLHDSCQAVEIRRRVTRFMSDSGTASGKWTRKERKRKLDDKKDGRKLRWITRYPAGVRPMFTKDSKPLGKRKRSRRLWHPYASKGNESPEEMK
ncbi:hypothetical protein TNCV_1517941 [Trichonephila clavipes]|nr:hypothetical protein TNCV_1517941 [Trichonephila clavipes]